VDESYQLPRGENATQFRVPTGGIWVGTDSMRMLWHDMREAIEQLALLGSLPNMRLAAIACGLGAALAAPFVSSQQAPATAGSAPRKIHHPAKPKPAVPESIPEVILPAPPLPERRVPEQMPPGVPQVSWDGNELTITADNSTLADILVAIRTRTGADIDVPPNASRERIAARLGPGPAREVIATLLSWTDFDYIIQASDSDPAGIHSVLLTPRSKSDTAVASAAMNGPGAPGRRANHRFGSGNTAPAEAQESSEGEAAETPIAATQPAPVEPQPAVAASDVPPAQPDAPTSTPRVQANLNPALATANSDLSQSSGNSTAERMQTLQNLYEQRKSMIQDARKPPAN
jgi:hypothetical protein